MLHSMVLPSTQHTNTHAQPQPEQPDNERTSERKTGCSGHGHTKPTKRVVPSVRPLQKKATRPECLGSSLSSPIAAWLGARGRVTTRMCGVKIFMSSCKTTRRSHRRSHVYLPTCCCRFFSATHSHARPGSSRSFGKRLAKKGAASDEPR